MSVYGGGKPNVKASRRARYGAVKTYTWLCRRIRGCEIQVEYAEGMRQHLGHCYPQENILKSVLGDLVHIKG